MYLLHRKKNGIYTNISVCLSYFEITVATLSSPFPDQMVDQHPEITSTALNVSRDQDTLMSPRDRSPLKTLSPRRPSGQVLRNQMSPLHNLTLLQLEFNCLLVWQEENCPPDWVFFVHSVTDGVLVPCRISLWLDWLGTLNFQRYRRLDCTDTI